ncbi:hypothetical protein GCM10010329_82140 [Streptomyces spiroverticillatus]|uniref:Uncharacterized protein n=1 Tax=Streptomyces finlayi TaxID=67296 RepID=A0A919CFT4_9ACTN|nr:hypothetical protein GCM10010329_82140 [Streptomyces spiroverticillatus]GHD18620.1 hypothetical protein GCM10010334_81660 [Streptomyces finlayi]
MKGIRPVLSGRMAISERQAFACDRMRVGRMGLVSPWVAGELTMCQLVPGVIRPWSARVLRTVRGGCAVRSGVVRRLVLVALP